MKPHKPELVVPAGSPGKLRTAFLYGADAVYCGYKDFSLRRQAENFTPADLKKAVLLAKKLGKKLYLAFNIYFYDADLGRAKEALSAVREAGVRTLILSDMGMLRLCRRRFPSFEVHLSTQANTTNSEAVKFYADLGVKRVILGRELSLKDIGSIRKKNPKIELEVFVHGAMCLAYSGRCFLSHYLSGRNANQGDCRQPCRWDYGLVRRGEADGFFPVESTERGSAILSSKDLNMSRHIGRLVDAGVDGLKIEGRMKGEYYVAVASRAYRHAIDAAAAKRRPDPSILDELNDVSHRPYFTGFYFGPPDATGQAEKEQYERRFEFIGIAGKTGRDRLTGLDVRNPFSGSSRVEVVPPDPGRRPFLLKEFELFVEKEGKIEPSGAVKIQDRAFIRTSGILDPGTVLRSRTGPA